MVRSRKQQKKSSEFVEDVDDDTISTCSTSLSSELTVAPKMEQQHDEEALLEGLIDSLYEKRANTREAALQGLIRAFTGGVIAEFAELKYETLSHLYACSVRRGSASEAALAARALGLLALTLGAGDAAEHVFGEASSHLVKVAKFASESAVRIAAVDSLAILCFVGSGENESTNGVMDVFWQIAKHAGNTRADQTLGIQRPSSAVKAAAIYSWAVLLSTLPSSMLTQSVQMSLPTLSSLLEAADLDVQKAAGEAIALIFETGSSNEQSIAYVTLDSESFSRPSPSLTVKSRKANEAHVFEQMKALSVEAGGKGCAKKEKSAQRSSFRELFASIQGGGCAETCIKLRHGDILRVDTWEKTLQLHALRKVLAEGFQIHMQENNLLHDIFNFIPRQGKHHSRSAKEKRLYCSPNSVSNKTRTQVRNLKRSIAHAGNVGQFGFHETYAE
ncbi:hypothetical protein O6H91_06G084000 [Diphasiastrum complanatum]|uniref:Uncharacterized protein n=1 Tax=Diphasiastrum complanatum TaxID=34168 RepID=A0ACC2DFN9_DIPCM|nr:hypothetical protein O6H91_Y341700 [Diphasiastrum complanatum]KAJ7553077.1 hypothetical protein O6H91_06G084000 [Diphasiastrum complanatum]